MEQNPCLRRYVVRDGDDNKLLKRNDTCVDQPVTCHFSCSDDLKVGFLYEIDHKQLPPKCPIQLRVMRVVMLAKMNELNVSVRFPSPPAFRAYFSRMELGDVPGKKYPDLDKQFVMGLKIAKKVLLRQILTPEFQDQGRLRSFWLLLPKVPENSSSVLNKNSRGETSESVDLVNIRKEAGVNDPYWTPPSGWKPGDSLSQDPNSSRELTLIKEEMTIIRGEMQDYKRDMQELLLWKREHSNGDKAIVPFVKSSTDQNSILECDNRIVSTNEDCEDYIIVSTNEDCEDYMSLVKRKAEMEEQLLQISKSLEVMEEEMKGSREKAVIEANLEVQILDATGESDKKEINEEEKKEAERAEHE